MYNHYHISLWFQYHSDKSEKVSKQQMVLQSSQRGKWVYTEDEQTASAQVEEGGEEESHQPL